MKEKLIVALDVSELKEAERLVNLLSPIVKVFKVGSILFTSCGVDVIKIIHRKGAKVFLDLKFHDIPNTVSGAIQAATRMGVFMLSIHILGGIDMLRGAVKSAQSCAKKFHMKRPKILGITVLTSMDDKGLKDVGIKKNVKEEVSYLAKLAEKAGLDGIVASAREISYLKKTLKRKFLIITPGIRPKGSARGDQRRVVTPAEAIRKGADYIVIGRPIVEAEEPRRAAEEILKEIKDV